MVRIEGTSARQLDLVDDGNEPIVPPDPAHPAAPALRLLRQDVYAELARRRRRAQIAARHEVDRDWAGRAKARSALTSALGSGLWPPWSHFAIFGDSAPRREPDAPGRPAS